ncbi:FecR domain-containing protein [bacterium]|nr:FecR domain-containing protein [bacterium]
MSKTSFTYSLPKEVQSDLVGMLVTDRNDLEQMWSTISDDAPSPRENGKSRVRSAIMAAVSESESRKFAPLRLAEPVARIYSMRLKLVSIAAALVVGLSISMSPSTQHYRADYGSATPTLVSLQDGSTVSLAAGSRISVPESFGTTNRRVILHGQAFFDVTPGSLPFEVKTFDSQTEVLGTSFSVKAWPGTPEASTEVVVKTGRVSVQTQAESVLVSPGEFISVSAISKESNQPSAINVSTALNWVDGGFYFDNELVENVIAEIERRYDVSINAPKSIQLRRFNYSTPHQAETANEVLGDLSVTIGVRYRSTANGFELYLDK